MARQQHIVTETDEDIARYSVLHDNDRLFMSKYLTYLPTKEQLKQEIERQKAVFYMQHPLQTEEGATKALPDHKSLTAAIDSASGGLSERS